MRVGLVSDSHDDEDALRAALEELGDVDEVIHAGDLCAPFIVQLLDEVEKPVHCVFGNIDDRHLTTKVAADAEHVTLHGNEADLSLNGEDVYVTHFPDVAEIAAKSGEYDLVVHGHTHEQREKQFGDTLLVNPGEILGRQERRGYAVYETKRGKVDLRRLDES